MFGHIEVLVNVAGYGVVGAVEEVEDEQTRQLLETNFFGPLHLMRAVLPVMRKQRGGYIINFSSEGGFVSFPGYSSYHATKFALEGVSESLAQEVKPLGIQVTIVEPGAFRTNWTGSALVEAPRIDEYAAAREQALQMSREIHGLQPGDLLRAAQAIIAAAEAPEPPLRLVLGADALQKIRNKMESVSRELNAWEETTINTAFTEKDKAAVAAS